ncbi:MAG: YcxB family protein, partial [Planctomycetota bacterium]
AVRRSVLGPRQVTIFDDGLYQRAAHGESLTHWPAIDGIEITGDHIFVMSESLPAAIIPRRAFASDSEREEFICEIQRRAGGPAPQPQ